MSVSTRIQLWTLGNAGGGGGGHVAWQACPRLVRDAFTSVPHKATIRTVSHESYQHANTRFEIIEWGRRRESDDDSVFPWGRSVQHQGTEQNAQAN